MTGCIRDLYDKSAIAAAATIQPADIGLNAISEVLFRPTGRRL